MMSFQGGTDGNATEMDGDCPGNPTDILESEHVVREDFSYMNVATCPDCGAGMIRLGSCFGCPICGFGLCAG